MIEQPLNKQQKREERENLTPFQKKLLEVSVWSEEEVQVFEENRRLYPWKERWSIDDSKDYWE